MILSNKHKLAYGTATWRAGDGRQAVLHRRAMMLRSEKIHRRDWEEGGVVCKSKVCPYLFLANVY